MESSDAVRNTQTDFPQKALSTHVGKIIETVERIQLAKGSDAEEKRGERENPRWSSSLHNDAEPINQEEIVYQDARFDPVIRAEASRLLSSLGERFNKARESGRESAFRSIQHDLMENIGLFVSSGLCTLKELMSISVQLEEFMKAEGSKKGQSAGEVLMNWLNGKD